MSSTANPAGSAYVDPLALQRENVSPTPSTDDYGSNKEKEGNLALGNDAASSSPEGDNNINNNNTVTAAHHLDPPIVTAAAQETTVTKTTAANATSANPSALSVIVPDPAATATATAIIAASSPVLQSPASVSSQGRSSVASSKGSDATTVANVNTTNMPTVLPQSLANNAAIVVATNNARNTPLTAAASTAAENPQSINNTQASTSAAATALASPMPSPHNPPPSALSAAGVPDLRLQLQLPSSSAGTTTIEMSSLSLLPPSPLALTSKVTDSPDFAFSLALTSTYLLGGHVRWRA